MFKICYQETQALDLGDMYFNINLASLINLGKLFNRKYSEDRIFDRSMVISYKEAHSVSLLQIRDLEITDSYPCF